MLKVNETKFLGYPNVTEGRGVVTKTLPCLRLKTELWRRGIKQIDLALSIRIDPSRLSKYVNGREEMPLEIKEAIAQTGGRRLMVGPGCVIPGHTPYMHIRAAREAVEK